jgi:hypothetical protein
MCREFSAPWTPRAIKQQCGKAHGRYKRELEDRYVAYFAKRRRLAGPHRYKASDLAAALPPGHDALGDLIPRGSWHPHYLSGGSSQVLAVALLGSAIVNDRGLGWLSELLELPRPFRSPTPRFEYALAPNTLNEEPRVTTIDLLVEDEGTLLCVEAKFWEEGLGSCRCGKRSDDVDPTDAAPGHEATPAQERSGCSPRILARPSYWSAAHDVLGLPERADGSPCPMAACYQAVRSVAAARALARGRSAVFALFFDERNPYFFACGEWPGWPDVLTALIGEDADVRFRARSWQQLLACGAVPPDVADWAFEKHGLGRSSLPSRS